MTVIDYLDFAASLQGVPEEKRTERIREAIKKTELSSKAIDPIETLSRGFRQRVGVAQTMLHKPRVLILDEPTNGLDPTQVQHMRGLIRSLAREATVIISTHILQEVQAICNRVIIVRNGQKALDAKMEELRAGKRLLVAVDAAPERALELFTSVEGVGAVERLDSPETSHRYALDLGNESGLEDTAPRVADRVAKEGFRLYAMQPENRDLETIFGEISAQ
jgi:ABC-2 type transport system ATP-binding protein